MNTSRALLNLGLVFACASIKAGTIHAAQPVVAAERGCGVDAVCMINAGDTSGGADCSAQLTHHDAAYFQLGSATVGHTRFPLNSIFNHEPRRPEVAGKRMFSAAIGS